MEPADPAPTTSEDRVERRKGLSRSPLALSIHYGFLVLCLAIFAISAGWISLLVAAVAGGHAAPGLLVTAPVAVLGGIGSLAGVAAGLGPVRARIRTLNRRHRPN